MPYPANYDTANSVESIIRSGKVTPATIALIGGQIHIGLTDALLQQISDPEWKSVKVSRRDLAPVLSQGANGGTTVAGTMYIAQSVGIPLFVTGGIGGVHRGAESSQSQVFEFPLTTSPNAPIPSQRTASVLRHRRVGPENVLRPR